MSPNEVEEAEAHHHAFWFVRFMVKDECLKSSYVQLQPRITKKRYFVPSCRRLESSWQRRAASAHAARGCGQVRGANLGLQPDLEAEIGRDEAEHFLRRFPDQIWISSFAGEDELMGHVPSVGQTRVAAPK